jgi:protein involved in polysaccharide export with SLBB domain
LYGFETVRHVTKSLHAGNTPEKGVRQARNVGALAESRPDIVLSAMRLTPRPLRRAICAGILALLTVPQLRAQGFSGSARSATRSELQGELSLLERSVTSPAYSERTRAKAREQAAVVRARLTNGDFRVGDRIRLRVVGPTQLVDSTLTVGDSLILPVPGIREVRLYGVLRSELTPRLVRDLGEVVRQVQVSAQPLLRIAVLGQVVTPGFQAVSAETLIDQLITLAGGPTAGAGMDAIQLTRGDTVLMTGAQVSASIAEGRTLGALDVRDGDTFVVPPVRAPMDRTAVLQIVTLFIGPVLTLLAVR